MKDFMKKIIPPRARKALRKVRPKAMYLRLLQRAGIRYVYRRVNGYRMKLDLTDNVVSRWLFLQGEWEPFETELLASALRPEMCFIDIGAHIGYYSLLAAREVGASGRVISFEPAPSNYALLTHNIRRNSLGNIVTVENKALSDRSGCAQLFLSAHNTGDHRIYSTTIEDDKIFNAGRSRHPIDIAVTTLDEYLESHAISGVDVIKMDTQGAEVSVVRGMLNTLRANPRILIFMEFWPHGHLAHGTTSQELLKILCGDFNLRLFQIMPDVHRVVPVDDLNAFVRRIREDDPRQQVDLICARDYPPAL